MQILMIIYVHKYIFISLVTFYSHYNKDVCHLIFLMYSIWKVLYLYSFFFFKWSIRIHIRIHDFTKHSYSYSITFVCIRPRVCLFARHRNIRSHNHFSLSVSERRLGHPPFF